MHPCEIDNCTNYSRYCIEWWGENQFKKNPITVDERYVCESHLVAGSFHEDYGGVPDLIIDLESDKERPELLEEVIKRLK